jgi:hypothetical protein
MRIGIVLTLTFNLPGVNRRAAGLNKNGWRHSAWPSAAVIALVAQPGNTHLQPWRINKPEPMRCIRRAGIRLSAAGLGRESCRQATSPMESDASNQPLAGQTP